MAGIIINGGSKPNIIPEESTMEFYIRAPTMAELETLSDKAKACFQGAAMTTGCEVRKAKTKPPLKENAAYF